MMHLSARTAFFLAVLLGGAPRDASTQSLSYALLFGAGPTWWSGPYSQGGKVGFLGVMALEARAAGPLAFRAELGGASTAADLGETGFGSEPTTLTFYRLHADALARLYPPMRTSLGRFFLELGASAWVRTGCDVDMVGGMGFLGGETVDCDAWEPDFASTARPLRPRSSGTELLLGIGGYRGRFGLALRYRTAGSPLVATDGSPMRSSSLALAAEWVFHGWR
jgi:hypothetical protein